MSRLHAFSSPSRRSPSSGALRLFMLLAVLGTATSASSQERLGIAVDAFGEGGALNGEQWINDTFLNESFQYGTAGLSGSAWLHFRHDKRLRYGPGVRAYGNYTSGGGRPFIFGLLFDAFLGAEYALPAVEKFEAVFGGRAGLSLLVPGGNLSDEITRLQREGVGVWSVPRVGWLAGVSVGTRRQMAERLWLRLDILAQYEQLFLFATDDRIDAIRFRKGWNTTGLRLGLALGAELSL